VSKIDEILKDQAEAFKEPAVWRKLDQLIESLPDDQRALEWSRVAGCLEARGVSSGHAHFRLGIWHLVNDSDEKVGIKHLEAAYEQDQEFSARKEPHRMAAYRVLGLVKDFLGHLHSKKNWQADQLHPPYRRVLITTLLAAYDASTKHILDAPLLTYKPFFALFKDEGLRRFAIENYHCACGLLELVSVERNQSFLRQHEYSLSRALVGLYGGVLEAILADKLGVTGEPTLGQLINRAHDAGLLKLGTLLSSLATVLLYFRNHVHANRDIARTEYFVDINVALTLKAATDVVVGELLRSKAP
jgi:hypothetical protein